MPAVLIIAGPNGAGKATFANETLLLPDRVADLHRRLAAAGDLARADRQAAEGAAAAEKARSPRFSNLTFGHCVQPPSAAFGWTVKRGWKAAARSLAAAAATA